MQARFTCENGSSRSSGSNGSFYGSIPSIIDSVHKPVSDDILRRLQESTRSDKKIEWRMRSKYEGGLGDKFDSLVNSSVGAESGSSRSDVGRRRDVRNDLRGDERHHFGDSGCVKLSPRFIHDDNRWSSCITREQCRRKGHVYGPQAIAAISGQRVTRCNVWEGSQSPRFQAIQCYDDGTEPRSHPWAQQSTGESGLNSPRRTLIGRNTDPRRTNNCHNSFMNTDLNCRIEELMSDVSSVCGSDDGKRDDPRNRFHDARESIQKGDYPLMTVGRVNLTIGAPFLGGDGDQSSKGSKKLSAQKLSKGTRRPMRRKQKAVVTSKRNSLSKTKVADKRHKGPKIEGIKSKHFYAAEEETRPRIRTAVLPYPQPKYKHTM